MAPMRLQPDLVMLSLLCGILSAVSGFQLITLDLDDTLWPTGAVVSAANRALVDALGESGVRCSADAIQV